MSTKEIQSIVEILKSHGGRMPLEEIYERFWETYVVFSSKKDWYAEYTKHGELRYHHIVRAALGQLKDKDMAYNPQRGIWTLI